MISDALTSIYLRYGAVRPSTVVDEARDPDSPLHSQFEWDDSKAGHEYRLQQARRIIRIHPVYVGGSEERLVHVPSITVGEGEYQPVTVVVGNPDMLERAERTAVARLEAAKAALAELAEAAVNTQRTKTIRKAIRRVEQAQEALAV